MRNKIRREGRKEKERDEGMLAPGLRVYRTCWILELPTTICRPPIDTNLPVGEI